MTPERAIEILNPEHREYYKDIETVNEACRMGMEAIGYRIKKKPIFDDETAAYYCPNCKKAQHMQLMILVLFVNYVDRLLINLQIGVMKNENISNICS